jgi:ABC-type amino acid transport substrate-binding protein
MGTLRVGIVDPNPPFTGTPGGLDVDLMDAIAAALGDDAEFVGFENVDGVLGSLDNGDVDCAAGGLSVTDGRAAFAPPYLITGQALAVDARNHPNVRSVDELDGLTIAVQRGSTAERCATQLKGSVKRCDRLDIDGCDAVIALSPLLTEYAKGQPAIDVVQKGLSVEHIAIAVAGHDQQMLSRITVAQAELEDAGTLQQLRRKWLGNPYADQSLAVH